MDSEAEEDVDHASNFWVKVLNLLTPWMLSLLNRALRMTTGSCLMPDPTTVMEVPEFMDSVIKQVEDVSGEKFSGVQDEIDEFMERAKNALDRKGGHANAL